MEWTIQEPYSDNLQEPFYLIQPQVHLADQCSSNLQQMGIAQLKDGKELITHRQPTVFLKLPLQLILAIFQMALLLGKTTWTIQIVAG